MIWNIDMLDIRDVILYWNVWFRYEILWRMRNIIVVLNIRYWTLNIRYDLTRIKKTFFKNALVLFIAILRSINLLLLYICIHIGPAPSHIPTWILSVAPGCADPTITPTIEPTCIPSFAYSWASLTVEPPDAPTYVPSFTPSWASRTNEPPDVRTNKPTYTY